MAERKNKEKTKKNQMSENQNDSKQKCKVCKK